MKIPLLHLAAAVFFGFMSWWAHKIHLPTGATMAGGFAGVFFGQAMFGFMKGPRYDTFTPLAEDPPAPFPQHPPRDMTDDRLKAELNALRAMVKWDNYHVDRVQALQNELRRRGLPFWP